MKLLFVAAALLCASVHARIVRDATSEPVFNDIRGGAYDATTGRSYWVTHAEPSLLFEVEPQSFRVLRTLDLGTPLARSMVLDAQRGVIYVGFATNPKGRVAKVNIERFVVDYTVDTFHNARDLAYDATNQILYVATFPQNVGAGAVVHKINGTDLDVLDSLELPVTDGRLTTIALDSQRNYLYVGNDRAPASIIRLWAEPLLRRLDTLTFPLGWDEASVSVVDGSSSFAYFGLLNPVGRIVQIDLENFRWTETVSTGTAGPSTAVIDNRRGVAYFTSTEVPSTVHRVRLCDAQLLEAEQFFAQDRVPRAVALNEQTGALTYGTSCLGETPCREPCNFLINFETSGEARCAGDAHGDESRAYASEDNTYSTTVNIRLGGMFPRGASCCAAATAPFSGDYVSGAGHKPAIANPPSVMPTHGM